MIRSRAYAGALRHAHRTDSRSQDVGALLAQHAIAEARRRNVPFINVRPVGRNIEATYDGVTRLFDGASIPEEPAPSR